MAKPAFTSLEVGYLVAALDAAADEARAMAAERLDTKDGHPHDNAKLAYALNQLAQHYQDLHHRLLQHDADGWTLAWYKLTSSAHIAPPPKA